MISEFNRSPPHFRPCYEHPIDESPYGHRCKYIHDVNVTSLESTSNIMFEHLLKPKKRDCDATIPPDRLYHRIINSITQSNPLVDPRKWKYCRPKSSSSAFEDTCRLIWNSVPVFPGSGNADYELASFPMVAGAGRASEGSFSSYSNIVVKNNPQVAFAEVHKLGIVLHMRATNDAHVDFTYAPVNCKPPHAHLSTHRPIDLVHDRFQLIALYWCIIA